MDNLTNNISIDGKPDSIQYALINIVLVDNDFILLNRWVLSQLDLMFAQDFWLRHVIKHTYIL